MVEFVVRVPEGTPPAAPLYLTGDAAALGRWQPDAIPLEPFGDETYRTRLDLPPGTSIEYLITLGRWSEAESDPNGRERLPRQLTATPTLTVDVHVAGWGRDALRIHPDFPSRFRPYPRPIAVALPPGYDLHPDRRYPVFYLQDGQNLFDPATAFAGVPWAADDTAERLARTKEIEPIILVGVGNTPDRIDEYGPRRHAHSKPTAARTYARFLVQELKPFIDAHYRTRPAPADTVIGGSSMGGLIALFLRRWHPNTFGHCAAISPSLWWERELALAAVRKRFPIGGRLWLDVGGREGPTPAACEANLRRARRLASALQEQGYKIGRDMIYEEFPEAQHTESAWAQRFDQVLRYLFGKEERG